MEENSDPTEKINESISSADHHEPGLIEEDLIYTKNDNVEDDDQVPTDTEDDDDGLYLFLMKLATIRNAKPIEKELDIRKVDPLVLSMFHKKYQIYGQPDFSSSFKDRKFKCRDCCREFSSFQALGGHRASHSRIERQQRTQNQIIAPPLLPPFVGPSPHHVIDIPTMKQQPNTFQQLCYRAIQSTPELRTTLVATLYGVQLGHLWALGNPFDMLTTIKNTYNVSSKMNFGDALSMFLPAIIWTEMFLLNLFYTTILAWSLPFRVPIVSMLLISLVYYFLALGTKMFGFSVLLGGSVEISGLMFVSGGALGSVLLIGFLLIGILFVFWRYFANSQN